MTVRIRLKRTGAKKQPHYRLVVTDSRSPRDGRFIEELGHFHPTANPASVTVDEERAVMWLSRGAQPSESVRTLFKQLGVLDKFREQQA